MHTTMVKSHIDPAFKNVQSMTLIELTDHSIERFVEVTSEGLRRVLSGSVGQVFMVDSWTKGVNGGMIAHVRDYRFPQDHHPYAIWSLAPGDYKEI